MSTRTGGARVSGADFLLDRLREEVARATRHNLPLACVLFRVKPRDEGEDASQCERLAHAATVLARCLVRHSDIVASLGCGRFGVVANTTHDGARILADALARDLEDFEFLQQGERLAFELTYGISCLGNGKTPLSLLEEARQALGKGQAWTPDPGEPGGG
jgi:PleD family two-component response regulator